MRQSQPMTPSTAAAVAEMSKRGYAPASPGSSYGGCSGGQPPQLLHVLLLPPVILLSLHSL